MILNILKKVICVFSLMLTLLFPPAASSSPWTLETSVLPGPLARFDFSVKITSWDIYNTTSNPLYQCSTCRIFVYVMDIYGVNSQYVGFINTTGEARNLKTLGELGEYLMRRGDFNKTFTSTKWGGGGGTCFFLGYSEAGIKRLPGGDNFCYHQVDPTYCNIYMPNSQLRHGTLSPDKINGNTVSTSLYVQCSADLAVRIASADRSGSINLKGYGGFRSELKVDGVNLGDGKVVTATPAGVGLTLSSTLTGYDGSIGTFQGSKTIVVSLP